MKVKYYLILIISSLLLCWDLFAASGQPANMDGTTHLVNIATFYSALKEGDFPVGWTSNYANYGLPMGYFAQQVTSYLGAFFTFLTHNVVLSINLVYLVGTIISVCLFYYLARMFVDPLSSLVGALMFQFAPYRITNMYIRGAVPEFFSSVFVLLILISLIRMSQSNKIKWILFNSLGIAGLVLTHPMNMVTASLIIGPLFIWYTYKAKARLHYILRFCLSSLIGLFLTGYYVVPLLMEIKYFYYGQMQSHFTPNSFLLLNNFISPEWPYFLTTNNDILARGHFIKVGLLETIILVVLGLWLGFGIIKKQTFKNIAIVRIVYVLGLICLFLTTPPSDCLYHYIFLLDSIQFPWRILSSFIILLPFTVALVLGTFKQKSVLSIVLIGIIIFSRFGQAYGKNVAQYVDQTYFATVDNPHNIAMNPIWSGPSTSYPVKAQRGDIVEGQGVITSRSEKNSSRNYVIEAQSDVRMADYTFYFPGWNVFIDGKPTTIEYQDPNYRGIITYKLNPGIHIVQVMFIDTKVRLLGKTITVLGLIGLIGIYFVYPFIFRGKIKVASSDHKPHHT